MTQPQRTVKTVAVAQRDWGRRSLLFSVTDEMIPHKESCARVRIFTRKKTIHRHATWGVISPQRYALHSRCSPMLSVLPGGTALRNDDGMERRTFRTCVRADEIQTERYFSRSSTAPTPLVYGHLPAFFENSAYSDSAVLVGYHRSRLGRWTLDERSCVSVDFIPVRVPSP